MIKDIWEFLSKFSDEAHQEALSTCTEHGFNPDSGVVPLNESYINFNWSRNTLKDSIEKNKLIQLPITIQKELFKTLETISANHDLLIAGTDTIVALTKAIEELFTSIWRYGLNHLSDEVLGRPTLSCQTAFYPATKVAKA